MFSIAGKKKTHGIVREGLVMMLLLYIVYSLDKLEIYDWFVAMYSSRNLTKEYPPLSVLGQTPE